jgi:hypothetical protein
MSEQTPSVGRIVHYVPSGPEPVCWPAIITSVGELCNLTLFPPGQGPVPIDGAVPYDSASSFRTWHWPERV